MSFSEPMQGMFNSSQLMILDVSQVWDELPEYANIRKFFTKCELMGKDPTQPECRQAFNDNFLAKRGRRYLVSRYGEDRSAMLKGSKIHKEGRTIHLGVDIFARELEPVFSPCDGVVVRTGYEAEPHGYGNYLIIRPNDSDVQLFFGHLGKGLPEMGRFVQAGEQIAQLGSWENNENGGWARHLHLQMITDLPEEGGTPIGYSSVAEFPVNAKRFPDPLPHFPRWTIEGLN